MRIDLTEAVDAAAQAWVKQLNIMVPNPRMEWAEMDAISQHKIKEDVLPIVTAVASVLLDQIARENGTESRWPRQ